jgi:quercetin 2,3-dioxygenase
MSDPRIHDEGVSDSRDGSACPGHPVMERIATRDAVLGTGMTIRRALPGKARRMIGAWCFLDHAGPRDYGRGQGIAVGPHPHIGLQTFTWMIEGEMLHRDSLGFEQVIRPGQVNIMTAGRGISHSEDAVSDAPGRLHAAQLWIALPNAERHCEPAFDHHPVQPTVDQGGFRITVLAGTAYGQTAPARVYTPLLGLDLTSEGPSENEVPLTPAFEHGVLVLRGQARIAGEVLDPGTLLYLGTGRSTLAVQSDAECQLLLLGGAPFDEAILLWWNFVGRTPAEIVQATDDWNTGRDFGTVVGSPSPRLSAPSLDGIQLKTR